MPLRKNRLYEYMPASLDTISKGQTLGMKLKTNTSYSQTETERLVTASLPDRDVYLFYSLLPSGDRHLDLPMDQVVDIDLFTNRRLVSEYGYTFGMVNSSSIPKKYRHNDYDTDRGKDWPIIVADSGGFQLASGAQDFLDPKDIVDCHNKACDRGMVLDIPIHRDLHKQLLPRAARIQKLNNDIFLKHKRKSLDLINIFHGATFYQRQKYRDVVETDDFTHCALGGMKTLNLLDLSLSSMKVFLTGKKYDQYHILGASSLERWVALCYMAHKKVAKLITSDSTSYIQSGVASRYYLPHQMHKEILLGEVSRNTNWHRLLPCQCPVCQVVKYLKPLGDKISLPSRAVVIHNLWVHSRTIDEIYELTTQPKKDILNYLKHVIRPGKLEDIHIALNAIDMACDTTPEKAAEKYAPHLNMKSSSSQPQNSLFHDVKMPTNKQYERLDKVISNYEKFHG